MIDRRQLSLLLCSLTLPVLDVRHAFGANSVQAGDWEERIAALKRAALQAFPYETTKVAGASALSDWEQLKRAGRGYPVVLGNDEDFYRIAEQLQTFRQAGHSPSATLSSAANYRYPEDFRSRQRDIERLLEERLRSDPKFREGYEALLNQLPAQTGENPRRGPWPSEPPECIGLTIAEEVVFRGDIIEHRPLKEATIALFPTTDWTEVFALSGYGGWNSCPPPEAHVAAFRRWNDRYGLELVGMSGDRLNLRVGTMPTTKEDALALALEQYEFCPDLVDQGDSLEALAAQLMSCGWWYFWWD